jgi:hypothetical protein
VDEIAVTAPVFMTRGLRLCNRNTPVVHWDVLNLLLMADRIVLARKNPEIS